MNTEEMLKQILDELKDLKYTVSTLSQDFAVHKAIHETHSKIIRFAFGGSGLLGAAAVLVKLLA